MPYPNDVLSTRAAIKHGNYTVVPPTGLVNNVIPGIDGCRVSIVASPKMGASFVQYMVTVPSGCGTSRPFGQNEGVETFVYVISGAGSFKTGGQTYAAPQGAYLFSPPGQGLEFINTNDEDMFLLLYKQRYIKAEQTPQPGVCYGNVNDIAYREYDGMSNVFVKDLLPLELSFDMNFHILSFAPGGCHPFVETHVQEHGAYILQGEGCYYLGGEWMMIKKEDFVWFGPFTTQAAYGVGREPFTYIYSKDCNRDVDI